MDDLSFGSRDKKGDWRPSTPINLPPMANAAHNSTLFQWLLGFLWPWNLIFLTITIFWWTVVLPDFEVMKTLSPDWILRLFLSTWLALFLWFGVFEFRLYILKMQARRFKYNHRFPGEKPAAFFWFGSQNIDNFIRSMLISVPVLVAMEVFILYCYANGYGLWLDPVEHPLYFTSLILLVAPFHETYFFFAHWLLHWPPLYKWCHAVHHNSINPSPWTSLSNHPLETFLQLMPALGYLLIPASPFIALYHLHVVAFSSVIGHIGFEKIEFGNNRLIDSHAYAHYLHHKHFECSYCDNGFLPWDKWFGTWHDGTREGDKKMRERYRAKTAKLKQRS